MDGAADVPVPQHSEVNAAPIERPPAEPWSTIAPFIVVLVVVLVNAATYGIARTMNLQTDLFDPLRIGITTGVVMVLAGIVLATVVGIKVSDNAVPPPGVVRRRK